MRKMIMLFIIIIIGLMVVGCSQDKIINVEDTSSTKERVYSDSWNGDPISVTKKNESDDYEQINEITDGVLVEKLISNLKDADWEENVKVDIEPSDYRFTWNSFEHDVWINEEHERLELVIEEQSNYGVLSKDASKIVFEILTGESF